MNYQKIIKESLFVLNYDRVENPLPKFFSSGSYADFLNHFNEPNTIQTPPGFTDGLPVIVARSKGGHSNLSVSALSSTISSKYDNGFENSLDKCMANLKDKVYPTFYIMEDVTGKSVKKIRFSGISFIIDLVSEKQEEKSIVEVFSNLTRFNVGSDIDINNDLADFNTKVALIYDNEFYVNITVGQSQDITGKRLTAIIDVNNKYGFSKDRGYECSKEKLDSLFSVCKKSIDSIDNYLNGRLTLNG